MTQRNDIVNKAAGLQEERDDEPAVWALFLYRM